MDAAFIYILLKQRDAGHRGKFYKMSLGPSTSVREAYQFTHSFSIFQVVENTFQEVTD